jgi:hypothetical protein
MSNNLTIYVASKSDARGMERTKAFLAEAAALGFAPALDWTALVAEARAAGYATDADVPAEMRRRHAEADWRAATTCSVFVYLAPSPLLSEGAAWEHGAAWTASRLTMAPLVIVVGRGGIFTELCSVRFDEDAEALAYLRRMVNGRAA